MQLAGNCQVLLGFLRSLISMCRSHEKQGGYVDCGRLLLPCMLCLTDWAPPNIPQWVKTISKSHLNVYHYVLRMLKTCLWDPRCQTFFFKPKLNKESKNGFKTISCRPYPVMIFSKNCFFSKKSSKKLDVLMIFELLWQCI